MFSFSQKRSGLYIDTGAAENLSGDRVLLEHQKFLDGLADPDLVIQKEPKEASYSGINGPPLKVEEAWTVPGFMGGGTGVSAYKCSAVADSDLPSLLCLNSVRSRTGILHSGHDSLYVPDSPLRDELTGVYRKFPLDYDGIHYALPFDKAGALDTEAERFELKEEVVEKSPDGTSKVWLTWKKLAGGAALAVAGAVAAALTPKKQVSSEAGSELSLIHI